MRRYIVLIVMWGFFPYGLLAQQKLRIAKDVISGQFSFEKQEDFKGWRAEKSRISKSDLHFKDGSSALLWEYSGNSLLTGEDLKGLDKAAGIYEGGIPEIYEPAFYPKGRYGGIKMWLYRETPSENPMIFQIGSDLNAAQKNPKYRFQVNMDFTGWRTIWVNFDEDARVPHYEGKEEMKDLVIFPYDKEAGESRLYIDHFTFLTFVSNKRHSDFQFVNHKKKIRAVDEYEILKPYENFLKIKYNDKADLRKVEEESEMIKKRLDFLILGDGSKDWQKWNGNVEKYIGKSIEKAKKWYDDLEIRELKDGNIVGKPLFSSRDEHPSPEGQFFQFVAQTISFPLALDDKFYGNKASGKKLLQFLDYFQDQGWAAGSAVGTVDHVIRLNPIANAIFLMRNELESQGKLESEIEMLGWHSRLGNLPFIDYTKGENTDAVRGTALVKLISILLMKEEKKRDVLLKEFKKYMDYVIGIAPGYSDTFKPDYSLYHHRGTYLNSYGAFSLNTMSMISWLLQGTTYELSETSVKILKEALKKQTQIAYGIDLHYGVSGRFPLNNSAIDRYLLPAFAYLSFHNDSIEDLDLAKRFNYYFGMVQPEKMNSILVPALSYSGTFGTLDLVNKFHERIGKEIEKPEDGGFVMPFSSLMTYRKGKAFASVKGYGRYVWDYESHKGENMMGRYLSFGTLITGQGNENAGFKGLGFDMNEGFHWGYLPGATTKKLPASALLYLVKPDKKYIEGKHRNFSESKIASGLVQNKNGLFALDLQDNVFPDKDKILFDSSFRALKSYFFIGDEIICLGSDISNDDSRFHTITTLFQLQKKEGDQSFYDGQPIGNSLNLKRTEEGGLLTDRNGLQYVIPNGQKVIMEQDEQSSYQVKEDVYQTISSPHTRVYLDHGISPLRGSYEYEILLNTDMNRGKSFLENKKYQIIRQDSIAHILYHPDSAIYAYAVFRPGKDLGGIITRVDQPVLAMFKQSKDYSLLTIADPDIRNGEWNHNMSRMPDSIVNHRNEGSIVTVVLKGNWYPAREVPELLKVTHEGNHSQFRIFCKDGKSVDLPVQRRE